VWEVYYPIAENRDVACRLGVLLYELGSYAEALCYFNRSLEIYGADPTVTYNMSMCHYELGQMEKALEFINETLLLDPRSKHARAMRIRIEATRKKEDECNITMN
jgi:tetratricopeptide (TPR) repeat protein